MRDLGESCGDWGGGGMGVVKMLRYVLSLRLNSVNF